MGVYIPNMDKPKSCAECELWSNCFYPKAPKEIDNKVMPDCPLIEMDDEAIDIAEDIMDGCKELKERVNKDLVRCGECIHHDEDGWGYGECKRPSVDYLRTADEDFCSYGERRADEN